MHLSGSANGPVFNAIILAPARNIGFAPGLVNGEIIGGGQQLLLVSGQNSIQSSAPEPSTLLLLGSSLVGLGALKRYRSKS